MHHTHLYLFLDIPVLKTTATTEFILINPILIQTVQSILAFSFILFINLYSDNEIAVSRTTTYLSAKS